MPQTSYISDAKPYYVLLFLLMIEKFSIQWMKDRFGCDDEHLEKFKSIEETEKAIRENNKKRQEEKNKLKLDMHIDNGKKRAGMYLNTNQIKLSEIPEEVEEEAKQSIIGSELEVPAIQEEGQTTK